MNYFANRRNPIDSLELDKANEMFAAIEKQFGIDWLTKDNNHPLQILWKRRDTLSSTELLSLGNAIASIEKIDPDWMKDQISKTLLDKNNRNGAFFEIIGLSYLINKHHSVAPAKKSQPGFDAVVSKTSGGKVHLSLKKYDLSQKHKEFNECAKKTEDRVVDLVKHHNLLSTLIFIAKVDQYPERKNWAEIYDDLKDLFNQYSKDKKSILGVTNGNWLVKISELAGESEFSRNNQSYTFIASAPYYKNENLNLYSKIDEACHNLDTHGVSEDDDTVNLLFIHLPETASVPACTKYANEYFEQWPDVKLSGVILYQPTFVINLEKKASHVDHGFSFVLNSDKYNKWVQKHGALAFDNLIGSVSSGGTTIKIMNGQDNNGIDLSEAYIYQSGHHYYSYQAGEGLIPLNFTAPGLVSHAIITLEKHQPPIELTGIFPPTSQLMLL
jgi:hypothetical protein